jgi:hypothetical protein
MTMTEADAQAWLEDMADRWLEQPGLTPAFPLGATEVGFSSVLPESARRSLRDGLYERFEVPALEFYVVWYGSRLTTTRQLNHGA